MAATVYVPHHQLGGSHSKGSSATAYPDVVQWMRTTRRDPTRGLRALRDDPVVADSRARVREHAAAAAENLAEPLARVT